MARRPESATAPAAGSDTSRPSDPIAGWWPLLRFMLRRERVGLPIWLLVAGGLVAAQASQSQEFFSTEAELAQLRATAEGNAAMLAMTGPIELAQSAGGEAVFEVFSYVAIVAALLSMVLVSRHTRGDEEAGRAELVRSARVGREAPLLAAVLLGVLANVGVAVAVVLGAVATGLPVGGSLVFGAAAGSVGLAFVGLTAVASQVFESRRGVSGAVVAVLGVSWVARAVGDVGEGTLSWLSPIGWGQRTYPYGEDRLWPLLLSLGVLLVGVGLAAVLATRRDLGAGLVATQPGRARASWALRSPLGLAWRLQRTSFVGWLAGVFLLGTAMGTFGETMEEFVADNPEIADFFPGGAQGVVDSFFAFLFGMMALLAAAYGVAAVLRARGEEEAGHAEPILATATSRTRWLGSHVTVALLGSLALLVASGLGTGVTHAAAVADGSQLGRLLGYQLLYAPGVWVVVGATVLLVGLLPRLAAGLAWAFVGYSAVVTFFGESFELPQWSRQLAPLDSVPTVPAEDVAIAPLLTLGAIALLTLLAGLVAFRRRDLRTG